MTEKNDAIRLLLIDDHPLVRDGLRLRLEMVTRLKVVGEAGDAEEALTFLERSSLADTLPHLALMDLNMRGMNGLELTRIINERYPDVAVLILSMHDNAEYIVQAIRCGARGYLLKNEPAHEIMLAVNAVISGRNYFGVTAAARLSQIYTSTALLTQREREILRQIAEGYTNKKIADELNLSVRTVETHRLNIKRKLAIDGQAELIKFAIENRGI